MSVPLLAFRLNLPETYETYRLFAPSFRIVAKSISSGKGEKNR
jgi:hypothetical protein